MLPLLTCCFVLERKGERRQKIKQAKKRKHHKTGNTWTNVIMHRVPTFELVGWMENTVPREIGPRKPWKS